MERQGGRCRKLVVVVPPLQGHMNPMLQLATILHSRGFPITIAHTQFKPPDASKYPDFTFLTLSSDDSSTASKDSDDPVVIFSDYNLNHRASLQEHLAQMVENCDQHEELPCIIYDPPMYFAEIAAHHLKLPSILISASSANLVIADNALAQLPEEVYNFLLQGSKSEEIVPGFHPLRFKDLPVFNFKNSSDIIFKSRVTLQDIGTSSAIIWNSIDFLDQTSLVKLQQQFQVPNFPIGPLQKMVSTSSSSLLEEDHSCITWLDKQTEYSVIYVSFGSVAVMDEKEVAEIAWGLANSKQPFLWVLRPGSVPGSEATDVVLSDDFKETVGERGYIVKWAPQKEVLSHRAVGGFLSHCGWNSTLESISEGVPMICRPFFGDQKVNTRYLSYIWRVGIELENVSERGEIARAIQRLMVEKEGKEMRQRALHLKSKIEISIMEGGSSYNSLNDLVELIMSV